MCLKETGVLVKDDEDDQVEQAVAVANPEKELEEQVLTWHALGQMPCRL